jgi:hypothetical protein
MVVAVAARGGVGQRLVACGQAVRKEVDAVEGEAQSHLT